MVPHSNVPIDFRYKVDNFENTHLSSSPQISSHTPLSLTTELTASRVNNPLHDKKKMNSTMVHLHNRSAMEDGIAVTSTGYLPSPSGLVSIEPQAGVAYDHRAAVDTLGAQQHSLGMNIFALGLWPGTVSNSHVPFAADPPHPATDFSSYSSFEQNVHVPSGLPAANHGSNYNYYTGAHSPSPPLPPVTAGSISVLPEQRPTINGTQSSAPPPMAWQRISNIRSHHARSDRGLFVSRDITNHTPSPPVEGPTSTTHPFPDNFPSASSPGVYSASQSSSSAFLPYPRGRFLTSTPIPQEPAYPTPRRAFSTSPVPPPVPPTCCSLLSSAGPSEKPVARPVPQKECTEQENAGRTLRSVRTRSEDVFAEYEPGADRTVGRWVCQCGSTFVRDSDWERHAMHSLSHSEGGGYDCTICDISFTRSDAMFRHRRKKHGDTLPGGKGAER